ncbi:MAG TPA: ASKHA domain-containing protein, partial [Terriglobales bacterium]
DSECKITNCEPLIESHGLQIEPPSLNDSRSDYMRIGDALAKKSGKRDWHIHPSVAAQFTDFANGDSWQMTAYTHGSQVVGFAESGSGPLGLAIDVGCTKIAAYLLDLHNADQLAAAGAPNPQITYGEDLISRLVYASKSAEQAQTLAACVRDTIATLATELCETANVNTTRIADVSVVGNTAMMHLLLQLPVARLLHAPFVASVDRDIDVPARDLAWRFAPGASVHVLPSIGGFVGADHVAMILARGIDRSPKITLGLDIGTNTEICIHDPRTGKLLTTSVPSGPVFEGAHIQDGMRAASGAIDKVFLAGGDIGFTTLDSAMPVGICGSGVLDLVAELRRMDVINARGHLVRCNGRVRTSTCGLEFVVVPAVDTGHCRDIVFTQHDVTQVQLAKAAISAGIQTLLEVAELSLEQVEEVAVAGAFGSYLDLRSALCIGLLPRFPNAEYLQIGNAAGAGAKMALVSRSERERAREIARKATRIELKKHSSFDRAMARATQFPPTSAR